MIKATGGEVGSDTVHRGGLGTSEAALTFKCHLLGREDLLADTWPRGDSQREEMREKQMKRLKRASIWRKKAEKHTAGGRERLQDKQQREKEFMTCTDGNALLCLWTPTHWLPQSQQRLFHHNHRLDNTKKQNINKSNSLQPVSGCATAQWCFKLNANISQLSCSQRWC